MKYFVSADIHGFYTEWVDALKEKQFDMDNPQHMLVVCGDLFDRGLQASRLQSFVMHLIEKNKIILVRGNHEDLALDLIDNYVLYMFNIRDTHHWHNGTFQTMLDLTGMNYSEATTCLLEFKRKARETDYVKKIIPSMKNFYETDNYVFVHAWVPLSEDTGKFDTDWRNASDEAWAKARWQNPVIAKARNLYLRDKTLVLGHWHCSAFWAKSNPKEYAEFGNTACYDPYISKEVIALDACTVVSKKVNVVVLED